MATRIFSAAIGIIITVCVLFLSDTILLNIVISAISVIMLIELFGAEKCNMFKPSYAVCIIYISIMPILSRAEFIQYRTLFSGVCVMALFITYIVQYDKLTFDKLSFMISTTLLISFSMNCMLSMKSLDNIHGTFYIFITLAAAWFGDSGAYFVGTFFGKHKMAEKISPKKTVEGAIGGIIIAGVMVGLFSFGYTLVQEQQGILLNVNYGLVVWCGLIAGMLGILGDLTASLLKRQCQIKDYGSIMPGHGGLVDRFDSVLFVAPFFYMVLSYFNIFY